MNIVLIILCVFFVITSILMYNIKKIVGEVNFKQVIEELQTNLVILISSCCDLYFNKQAEDIDILVADIDELSEKIYDDLYKNSYEGDAPLSDETLKSLLDNRDFIISVIHTYLVQIKTELERSLTEYETEEDVDDFNMEFDIGTDSDDNIEDDE